MASTTFSSRQFNQDASGAKRAAAEGPVFVTTRGETSHVLLSIEEYRRLTGPAAPLKKSIVEMLAMDGDMSDDFDELLERIRQDSRREKARPLDLD